MATSSAETFEPPFDDAARGYARVADLKPHPKNEELYTDRENADLVNRIETHGFRESQRLLVCTDGTILSGHRRWDAAKQVGIERVPVEVADVDPDSDEALLELLTANLHRVKTPAEEINEAMAWEEIERERAQERMEEGGRPDLGRGETGRSSEKAAEKVGMGRETYRKGKKVKEVAESGDPIAQAAWNALENDEESIHGAYTTVMDALQDDEEETGDAEDGGREDETEEIQSTETVQEAAEETDSSTVCEDGSVTVDDDADAPEESPEPPDADETGSDACPVDHDTLDDGGKCPECKYTAPLPAPDVPDGASGSGGDDETGSFTPLSEIEDGDRPGESASERQLRRMLTKKNSRIDELETIVRRFINAVNNEDPEAIRATAEEAEGLVSDA